MTNIRHLKTVGSQKRVIEQALLSLGLEYEAWSDIVNNIPIRTLKQTVQYMPDTGYWKIGRRLYKMDAQAVLCRLEESTRDLRLRVKQFKATYPDLAWFDREYTECSEPRTIRVKPYVNRCGSAKRKPRK